uniref:Putative membrane glycoprotein lig-1 n=2 Tax=Ixodes ricinus TaxID=34613 RepID=V5HEW7_IXORI
MSIPISDWRIPLTLAAILSCWAPWRSPSAEAASLPCDVFNDVQGLCRCTLQEKTPTNDSHNQVWVTCVNLTSLEHLSLVLSPMRGRRIDKFQLGLSRVGYVPSNLFLDIAVQELQFWDSPLSTFVLGDERAFLGLESTLRWLSMRRCRLNSSLPFQRMGHLHALETLDLSFNELTVIRESWFRNSLNGLRSLLLRGNRIELVESRAFAGLLRLYQLDLAQNNLKHLKRSMFPSGLFFLDLSDNRLSFLTPGLLDGMTNLRRVYLNGNRVTTLAQDVWAAIWSNPKLGVEILGNPLVCDCSLQWIVMLFPRRCFSQDCQRAVPEYRQLDGRCNSPPSVAGLHLSQMTCDSLPCDTPCPKLEPNDVPLLPDAA